MITRRRFLTNSSALALTSLGIADALAQGGGLAQSGLVGKLEGPQVVTDPAAMAEELQGVAGARRAGEARKLPPVAQRIPARAAGAQAAAARSAGTAARGGAASSGPGDGENGNRINASDKLLFWDYTGTKIVPSRRQVVDDERGRQDHRASSCARA